MFCVSVDMGTCIIFFYTLCTLRNVHRGNFLLDFLHTYFVKHVFVDGSCHNHEGMLLLLSLIEYCIQFIMLFTIFLGSVHAQQAVRMSSMLQALRQRWRAEDAHENA